jgi:hypothetical protein
LDSLKDVQTQYISDTNVRLIDNINQPHYKVSDLKAVWLGFSSRVPASLFTRKVGWQQHAIKSISEYAPTHRQKSQKTSLRCLSVAGFSIH